jgi:hypothetical protein
MTMPNHIVQIDRATLEKLYWEEGLSLTQAARNDRPSFEAQEAHQ